MIEGAALPDPVIFLEHIGMYGLRGGLTGWGDSINQDVDIETVNQRIDSNKDLVEIGRAKTIRGGRDVTIVTWGAMVHIARHAAEMVAREGIETEIVDLRTLLPFDAETCVKSVQRTGRMMVLQESQWSGGFGQTVSSRILEEAFWALESPPVVVGALDTPVPFSPPLEDHTIPDVNLVAEHLRLLMKA